MRNNKQGFTMVEMIVVMMLTGILLPLFSSVLGAGIRISQRMILDNQAAVIGEIVLDRITYEISSGRADEMLYEDAEEAAAFAKTLFGDDFYMGYEVEKLTFRQEEPKLHPGLIRMDLTLREKRTGSVHRTFRYVEIYDVQNRDEGSWTDSDADEIPLINDLE